MIALLLAAALATQPPAIATAPCTSIPVVLVDALDSGKARTGDVFRFRTVDTIVTRQNVTLPRDTIGYGLVSYAGAAGSHGRAGDLMVEARYIDLGKRGQFPVTIDSVATSAVKSGSTGNAPGAAGAIPVPFVGTAIGAFNYFHAGKNATIAAGSRFVVIPVGNLAKRPGCAL